MSALLWTPPMQTNLVISGHLLSSHSETYTQLLLISKTAEKRRFLRLCLEKQHGAAPCKSCVISWRTPDPTTYQGICVGCFGSAAKSLTGKPLAHPNNLSFWILGPRPSKDSCKGWRQAPEIIFGRMRLGEIRWKYFLKLLSVFCQSKFFLTYLCISAQNSPDLAWAEWGVCSLPRWAAEFTLHGGREGKESRIRQGDAFFFFLSGIKPDAANLPLIKQYFTFRKRQLNCTEKYGTIVLPEVAESSCSEHKDLLNAANRRSHITTRHKRSLMSVRPEKGCWLGEIK